MAVFVAAADETGSGDGTGAFYYGGYVAPQLEWDEFFVPAWQERVLDTQPRLGYFHTTELKSPQWRLKNGIGDTDAERKVDEAIRAGLSLLREVRAERVAVRQGVARGR